MKIKVYICFLYDLLILKNVTKETKFWKSVFFNWTNTFDNNLIFSKQFCQIQFSLNDSLSTKNNENASGLLRILFLLLPTKPTRQNRNKLVDNHL